MEEKFITYKDQAAIRVSDVSVIMKSTDIEDGHGNYIWRFSSEKERDKVYDKILQIIDTNKIVVRF